VSEINLTDIMNKGGAVRPADENECPKQPQKLIKNCDWTPLYPACDFFVEMTDSCIPIYETRVVKGESDSYKGEIFEGAPMCDCTASVYSKKLSGYRWKDFDQMKCVDDVLAEFDIPLTLSQEGICLNKKIKDPRRIGSSCINASSVDVNQDIIEDAWPTIEKECMEGMTARQREEFKEFFGWETPPQEPGWWESFWKHGTPIGAAFVATGAALSALVAIASGVAKTVTGKGLLELLLDRTVKRALENYKNGNGKTPKTPKKPEGPKGGDDEDPPPTGGKPEVQPEPEAAGEPKPAEPASAGDPTRFSVPEFDFTPNYLPGLSPTPVANPGVDVDFAPDADMEVPLDGMEPTPAYDYMPANLPGAQPAVDAAWKPNGLENAGRKTLDFLTDLFGADAVSQETLIANRNLIMAVGVIGAIGYIGFSVARAPYALYGAVAAPIINEKLNSEGDCYNGLCGMGGVPYT